MIIDVQSAKITIFAYGDKKNLGILFKLPVNYHWRKKIRADVNDKK